MKISGVYKITNTITNDFYIGSSRNVKQRWICHKSPSLWKRQPNNPLYQDMQKYGVDKFEFQILVQIEPEQLKEQEQEFIEKLQPTYNNRRANGLDIERLKKNKKKYRQAKEYKEYQKEYNKKYQQSEKGKETKRKARRKYNQSEKGKKCQKKYNNRLCSYNGEMLTLNALSQRFYKAGIEHPTAEAKKFLLYK